MFILTDILGGTIATLFAGLLQAIISFVVDIIACIMSVIAYMFLKAMSVNPESIENMLGSKLTAFGDTSTIAYNITMLGLAIGFIFALIELIKGLMASVTGEDQVVRPYTIAVRGIVFGAWAVAGIPTSKLIFNAGSSIYNGMLQLAFGTGELNGFIEKLMNNFDMSTKVISADVSGGLGNIPDWVLTCISTIVGGILFVFIIWNFIKLLLECAVRYAALIFYTYLSPLAIGCGVSPTWSKITWAWMKMFISTIILWILNIWCVYGGLQIMKVDIVMSNMDFLGWAFVAYGYMKAAQQLDNMFSAMGASVTKSSGSLLGDMREMMAAGAIVGGVATGTSNFMAGAAEAMHHGAGPGGNMAKFGNLQSSKANGPESANRNVFQNARDAFAGGFSNTKFGSTVLGTANSIAGLRSSVAGAFKNEPDAAKRDQGAVKTANELKNNAANFSQERANAISNAPNAEAKKAAEASFSKGGSQYEAFRQKQKQAMADGKAHGVTLNNNGAVMEDLAQSTLYDAQHPEKGSMADNGLKCTSATFGDNGGINATFAKKADDEETIMEKRSVSGIGTAGTVQANSGEAKSLNNGAFAGSPGSQTMYGGQTTGGYKVEGRDATGVSYDSSATVSGIDKTGKSYSQRVTPAGEGAFRVDDLNSAGKATRSQMYYGKDETTTAADIAGDLGSGTMDNMQTRQVKDNEGNRTTVPVTKAMGGSSGARMTQEYMTPVAFESPSASGGSASVDGSIFGGKAGEQYSIRASENASGTVNVGAFDSDGHAAKTWNMDSDTYENAIQNQASLNSIMGQAPKLGEETGQNPSIRSGDFDSMFASTQVVTNEATSESSQDSVPPTVSMSKDKPQTTDSDTRGHSRNADDIDYQSDIDNLDDEQRKERRVQNARKLRERRTGKSGKDKIDSSK